MTEINPKYQISSLGFLPETCINQLPDKFLYLQPLINNLSICDGEQFREIVANITVATDQNFTMEGLIESEIKFIYSITCMIINKYIWCLGSINATAEIPQIIGQPWINSADFIGIAPALTHAAIDLYNWSLIDPTKEFKLDNLKSNYLMTGNPQEEWFYLIMVAIEGHSGQLIKAVHTILNGLEFKKHYPRIYFDDKSIVRELYIILECMKKNIDVINRMHEKCTPNFFFNKLRIYLSGSSNKKYFPKGFKIEGMEDRIISYDGGSAAQSSLIQTLDIFFSVKHDGKHKQFLDRMHDYMPQMHAEFLMILKSYPKLCDYINIKKNDELKYLYDECLIQLRKFRNCHFQIVHKYIVPFITKEETALTNVHGIKGSGGTDPEQFLSALIKDTTNARNNIIWYDKKSQQCILLAFSIILLIVIFNIIQLDY